MPIVVTTPVQGDAVTPGAFIRASTQSVLPVGHHWDALVFQADTQDILADAVSFVEGQSVELRLGVRTVQPGQLEPIFHPQLALPVTGAEVEMHVRVISAQSTIVDTSGPIGIQWQPNPWGVAYVQSLQASTPVSGSFTEEDRTTINATLAGIQIPIVAGPVGVPNVIASIGELLELVPNIHLRRAETLLLSGRGTLLYPAGGTEVQAYGAHLSSLTAPPGAGFRDGVIREFELRVAQFAVYGRHGTVTNFVSMLRDWDHAGEYLKWPMPFPRRIEYDITPGFTVGWTWLVVGIQP